MLMLSPLLAAALIAPPNIVIIHVDDLGWQDTSVPMHTSKMPPNAHWHTPNIERLASEGAVLTNGYAAAPVCTPTRVSLMTGQTPGRHGTTYWTLHKDTDTSRKHPRLTTPAWQLNGLQPDTPTLPSLLQARGYRTIHAGKAHFGTHDTPGSDPLNLGFDVNIAGHGSGGPASYLGTHNFSVAGRSGGKNPKPSVWDIPGLEDAHGQDVFLTEVLSRKSCAEVDRAVAQGKPFLLHFAPYAVHTPIMANARLLERYGELHPKEAAYATMIESVDNAVGDILTRLDAHGIADDTIVIFTSDNGGLSAHARGGERHTHNTPLKSGKGSAYEGGTRVPWIIRWPGVATAGSRIDTPVVTNDVFPTLLNATNTTRPEGHHVDGVDLGPILKGAPHTDRTIGWHQPHQWGAAGPGIEPFTSIRHGRWKLLCFHDGPRFELYDLETDPGEMHDALAEQPEVADDMLRRLTAWMADTGAPMSNITETGEPVTLPLSLNASP